jgi:hypothetical protein
MNIANLSRKVVVDQHITFFLHLGYSQRKQVGFDVNKDLASCTQVKFTLLFKLRLF